ncbi:PaaX family transcriptional regulator C-terminal domain-containing protein [Prescottella agglutinans]|uniref:Phenylacetic acid degradation operon negative regulatory protein n=1 Tax=Prescottella agglutinans TaxID=1644129 RepID=A0ABT6M5Z4_9NOCA|nr:PaaX family transcriptional regulator C-terminal domain-containing protein [Prescottella agglutinans]MDH6279727.1 phenylacetic acid degradation operon negative regulatory protein [Prescottella agglutinans]
MSESGDHTVEVPTRVLVESMVRGDATIDANELYSVANALGMTDQQVRLCIRRLVTDGQFTQEGRGRRAVLRASKEVESSIAPNVEFVQYMFAQDRGDAPWDGTWHLVAFAIPEAARHARDAMRDGIMHLGGAPIQGGLYVSPNPWEPHVRALASTLDVADNVTFCTTSDLTVGGAEDPRAIAAGLWPLDSIASGHAKLVGIAQQRLLRLRNTTELTQTEAITIAIELASEFTRAMTPDPLLPPELLPHPWPGTHARALTAECWSILLSQHPSPARPRLFRSYGDVVQHVTDQAPRQTP